MDVWLWSILLLLVGIGLIGIELFVPSGGVLGVLAVLAIIGSIVVAFTGGTVPGVTMLLTNLVLIPVIIAVAIKWWPYTPIGKAVVLQTPVNEEEVLPDNECYRKVQSLVGRRGVAKTKMLPSGAVVIEGETYDAVSEGVAIEPGQPIRVIAIDMNRIIVAADTLPPQPQVADAADVLLQPADKLGLQSLDEPPS
jgi:membrane-bound serine protease (ClpP class)